MDTQKNITNINDTHITHDTTDASKEIDMSKTADTTSTSNNIDTSTSLTIDDDTIDTYYDKLDPLQVKKDIELMKVASRKEIYELILGDCKYYISIIAKNLYLQNLFNIHVGRFNDRLSIKFKMHENENSEPIEVCFLNTDNTDNETLSSLETIIKAQLKLNNMSPLENPKITKANTADKSDKEDTADVTNKKRNFFRLLENSDFLSKNRILGMHIDYDNYTKKLFNTPNMTDVEYANHIQYIDQLLLKIGTAETKKQFNELMAQFRELMHLLNNTQKSNTQEFSIERRTPVGSQLRPKRVESSIDNDYSFMFDCQPIENSGYSAYAPYPSSFGNASGEDTNKQSEKPEKSKKITKNEEKDPIDFKMTSFLNDTHMIERRKPPNASHLFILNSKKDNLMNSLNMIYDSMNTSAPHEIPCIYHKFNKLLKKTDEHIISSIIMELIHKQRTS
jgi:hypothetical protein